MCKNNFQQQWNLDTLVFGIQGVDANFLYNKYTNTNDNHVNIKI